MKEDENILKARIAGNRVLAALALFGALICLHYAYASSGWREWAWAAGSGILCGITITRTVKASVYASGLMVAGVIDVAKKEGMLR